jgi:hypothetical protein
MFDNNKNQGNVHAKLVVGAGLVAAGATSLSAAAADIDTTAIVATITAVGVAAGLIGVAVLSMHYGIKAYKWIKGAG